MSGATLYPLNDAEADRRNDLLVLRHTSRTLSRAERLELDSMNRRLDEWYAALDVASGRYAARLALSQRMDNIERHVDARRVEGGNPTAEP
jgi:hypothetical protein